MTRLEYDVKALPAFKVFIGREEYLVCKEVYRQVGITIQNTVVTEDLFILPMEGANIVLGIQWLGKLGPVTTNHKDLTMEFQIEDQSIRFQGESHLFDAKISKTGLWRLMVKGDVAYFCHLHDEALGTKESKFWPELVAILKEFEDVLVEPQ